MTFPQPNSNDAPLLGQDYFRLNTQLQTPGDLFESEVSCHAVALGPNSDIATLNVFYRDPIQKYVPLQVQSAVDQSMVGMAVVSPDRPFIGRIDADETEVYPLVNRPGRILFAAGDIIDPNYLPQDFNPTEDSVFYEPIYIDVMQYLTPPPALIPQRSDKTFRYQYFAIALVDTGSSFVVIPAYGRKSGTFSFVNRAATDTITAHVFGVRLSTSNDPGTVGALQEELFSSSMAPDAVAIYAYDASDDGLWDCFYIELEGYKNQGDDIGPAFPTTITLSDDAL